MSDVVHHANDDPHVPRGALFAAAALVIFSLAVVGFARIQNVGVARMTPVSPVDVRELHFADRADGGISVISAADGSVVNVLQPGTNGFVRSVLRSLAQTRKRQNIDAAPPFKLVRWGDGHFTLEDPSIGQRIDLAAFGSTNMDSFARLMTTPGAAR